MRLVKVAIAKIKFRVPSSLDTGFKTHQDVHLRPSHADHYNYPDNAERVEASFFAFAGTVVKQSKCKKWKIWESMREFDRVL
jgi:hypothetical protein